MPTELKKLHERLDKVERHNEEEALALIEILSNVTFFGEIKRSNCEYAHEGQCTYFIFQDEQKNRIPIVTKCRAKNCTVAFSHCHLETSDITCTLCQKVTEGKSMNPNNELTKNQILKTK